MMISGSELKLERQLDLVITVYICYQEVGA